MKRLLYIVGVPGAGKSSVLSAAIGPEPVGISSRTPLRHRAYVTTDEPTRVLLDTPREVAAERRAARGSTQHPLWVRGRETKVENLRRYASAGWILDGREAVDVNAGRLRAHPVIAGLRSRLAKSS